MRNGIISCTLFLWASCAFGQIYSLSEIEGLGGNPIYTQATAINASGQVTGYSLTANGYPHAFLYANGITQDLGTLGGAGSAGQAINSVGQVTGIADTGAYSEGATVSDAFVTVNGTMQDLGTLGGNYSIGQAINASGQVTGRADITDLPSVSATYHAFVTNNGVLQDLGTFSGIDSWGLGINDSGQVTGYAGISEATTPPNTFHAFIANNGVLQDLGTINGTWYSIGVAINEAGQVAGYGSYAGITDTSNGCCHAFLYSNGLLQDLGTLGGATSFPNAINASGQITGAAATAAFTSYLETPIAISDAFLYSNGAMQDLGALGPAGSLGYGIDSFGDVVGFSATANNPTCNPNCADHAFLYTNGRMYDLNGLIAPSSPLAQYVTLTSATAITDTGYILAQGTDSRDPTSSNPSWFVLHRIPPVTVACPIAAAQAGSPYSSALTATGGISPYALSITFGSLPPGLTLNPTTGAITGVPSAIGTFNFSGQVVDSSGAAIGTVTSRCSITVIPQLTLAPASISFGVIPRFGLLVQSVTLKNNGITAVSLGKVSVTPRSDGFVPISLCGPSLGAGRSCTIFVLFEALKVGSFAATLNIPNSAVAAPQSVALSATAVRDGF